VITTALSAVIVAARAKVWHAIIDPTQVIRWDEPMLALLEPVHACPHVGQHMRWRYRLGAIPVVYHERTVEVVPEQLLRSMIAMGLFHFQQTWSLVDENGDPQRTRLGLRLSAANALPVVSGLVDRFSVRRLSAEYVDTKLHALQEWCESCP
jgi:uncharacterized protein YndB with AHSA1/START domain